jgi:hypothetical protein
MLRCEALAQGLVPHESLITGNDISHCRIN